MSLTPENAAARALFEKMASEIEKEIDAGNHDESSLKVNSPFAASTSPYLKLENVLGVHIHHNGSGWIGDVILGNVPDGVPNVLGTPEKMPRRAYSEAENDARGILRFIILNSRGQLAIASDIEVEADDRYFDLGGLVLTLTAEQVGLGQRLMATVGMTPDIVIELLVEKLREDFNGKPDSDAFLALDEKRQTIYVGFAAALLSQGVISLDADGHQNRTSGFTETTKPTIN